MYIFVSNHASFSSLSFSFSPSNSLSLSLYIFIYILIHTWIYMWMKKCSFNYTSVTVIIFNCLYRLNRPMPTENADEGAKLDRPFCLCLQVTVIGEAFRWGINLFELNHEKIMNDSCDESESLVPSLRSAEKRRRNMVGQKEQPIHTWPDVCALTNAGSRG